jgi:TonB family protein
MIRTIAVVTTAVVATVSGQAQTKPSKPPKTVKSAEAASVPAGPTATPVGNPADWFPANAYPQEAKAAGMEGRTEFKLDIDPLGRIVECDIAKSSGSPLLDSTTCALLVQNARFRPAVDAAGKPIAGTWQSAMVWKLASAAPDIMDGYSGQTGKSPAEIYNDSVSAEQKQAEAARSAQDQGGGGGDAQ